MTKDELVEQAKKTKDQLLSDMEKEAAKKREEFDREIMLAEMVPDDLVPARVHPYVWPRECLGTLEYHVDTIDDVEPIFEQLGSVPLIKKEASGVSFIPEEVPGRIDDRDEITRVNPVTYYFKPSWSRRGHNPKYAQPTDGKATWYTRLQGHLVQVDVKFKDERITIAPDHVIVNKRVVEYKWVFCAPCELFPVYRTVRWWTPVNRPPEYTIYWERGTDG